MTSFSGRRWASIAGLAILTAAVPAAARGEAAELRLLDEELRPPQVLLALAEDSTPGQDRSRPAEQKAEPRREGEQRQGAEPGTSLDFDLLGAPASAHQVDESALRLRRTLLTVHQGVGLGMFGLQLATTVLGQLNYIDKFGGDNTNKYKQTHAILAYSTLAAFVAAGTLALLAPSPLKRDGGFDRVSLHKIAMFTAAAGMLAQGALGIWTKDREGYFNQRGIATAHLVIGYVTLAAVTTGVGALIL